MKVVVDTNVLISGIFFDGPPARILKAWLHGEGGIPIYSHGLASFCHSRRLLAGIQCRGLHGRRRKKRRWILD